MSDLNSFAELIRKGKEDKRLKEAAESERKQKEFGPMLTDLFKTVVSAKKIADAVWSRSISNMSDKTTIGGFISKVLLTIPKFLGLK